MECYYGKGERRRLIGRLVAGDDGALVYQRLNGYIVVNNVYAPVWLVKA